MSAGSERGAMGTSHVPSGCSESIRAASSVARRVLPMPAAPATVTMRARRSRRASSSSSRSRPTKLVSWTRRLFWGRGSALTGRSPVCVTCPRRHKWSETVLAPVYRYFPPSREPAAPDTIASLRGWHGFHIGATGAQYSLKYRVGVSRPGTPRPNLYSRPGRTVPRDVRPWQDVASARARARELAPKIHAARRRVIAHHEAGHLIVAAHLGVMVDEVSVEVARRFSLGAVHVHGGRGRPRQAVLATILAAGGEAERKFTGVPPQGIEADEAQLAGMAPRTVSTGRVRA